MAKGKTDKLPIISELPKQVGLGIFYGVALILMLVIAMHTNPLADQHTELIKKVCAGILIVMSMILFTVWYDKLMVLPVELYNSRKLIWRLAVNDFKKRYAGSYMGVVWALAQPVVTVLMYWFVFSVFLPQKGQLAGGGTEIPFVLFLTTGLVPWFFFTEAWMNGTTSLLEYNYLVKKVVFNISILPIIRAVAAVFTHLFFIVVI